MKKKKFFLNKQIFKNVKVVLKFERFRAKKGVLAVVEGLNKVINKGRYLEFTSKYNFRDYTVFTMARGLPEFGSHMCLFF